MDPEEGTQFEKSFRGPKLGLQSSVRDETWWKFRAMPGESLRQNQQTQAQQSLLIMGPEKETKFAKSFRGPKLGLQSSVRGGVWTV